MARIDLVPRELLEKELWWTKLTAGEQRQVLLETQALTEVMIKVGMGRLEMGQHFSNLRDILEPKRIFVRYIKSQFGNRLSVASVYRYIELHDTTREKVPELVLRTAIARGYDIIDAEFIERNPPPKTQDRLKIIKYLDKVAEAAKEEEVEEVQYDPETLMRETLNFMFSRFGRLPTNHNLRAKWRNQLISMFLSESGAKEEMSFVPIEVPDSLRVIRGRPRLSEKAS